MLDLFDVSMAVAALALLWWYAKRLRYDKREREIDERLRRKHIVK